MKKFLYLFVILLLLIVPSFTVHATNTKYIDLMNFDFKIEPLIGRKGLSRLTFEWNSVAKMDEFKITIFNSDNNEILIDYNSAETDIEVLQKLEVSFSEQEPIEEGALWEYRLSFVMKTNNVATVKMLIYFSNDDNHYTKVMYLPISSSLSSDPQIATRNAIFSAIFAVCFAVIATLIIIITSQYKTIEDESGE